MEKDSAEGNYHAVGDQGVPFRDIANAIGKGLNVPVVAKSTDEANDHFGWIARFAAIDCPASSARTQEELGWQPTHVSLIPDIEDCYFESPMKAAPAK